MTITAVNYRDDIKGDFDSKLTPSFTVYTALLEVNKRDCSL